MGSLNVLAFQITVSKEAAANLQEGQFGIKIFHVFIRMAPCHSVGWRSRIFPWQSKAHLAIHKQVLP